MRMHLSVLIGLMAAVVLLQPCPVWAVDEPVQQASQESEQAEVICPNCETVTVVKHITDKVTRKTMKHLCPSCGMTVQPSEADLASEQVHVCDACGAAMTACEMCAEHAEGTAS